MRSRIRWISSASRRFSFSSARLCVMFTPREMAATPSTRKVNATTLPMPMSALTKVCDTSTARDDPEPCGTTMTVQRRSAFLRIRSPRPRIKTVSPGTEKARSWRADRSEEHTSELQSQSNLVCRLLLEKKKKATPDSYGSATGAIEYPLKPRVSDPCNEPTSHTARLFRALSTGSAYIRYSQVWTSSRYI